MFLIIYMVRKLLFIQKTSLFCVKEYLQILFCKVSIQIICNFTAFKIELCGSEKFCSLWSLRDLFDFRFAFLTFTIEFELSSLSKSPPNSVCIRSLDVVFSNACFREYYFLALDSDFECIYVLVTPYWNCVLLEKIFGANMY